MASQPPPDDPLLPAQIAALSDHALKRLDAAYTLSAKQVVDASKWLLATLVAINGGGVLATVNLLSRLNAPAWPACLFAAGLLIAVVSGVVIQHVGEAALGGISEMESFWRNVGISGNYDEAGEKASRRRFERTHHLGLVAPALGWIAGFCFFFGLISLSHQASMRDVDNDARCLALQRDMLSAVPRKETGPALFQAFGCRPQGKGSVIVPVIRAATRH